MSLSDYGIVIPSKNRLPYLVKTLWRLDKLEVAPKVVIIVDASADAATLIDVFKSSYPDPKFKLVWLCVEKSGTSYQRNVGIHHMKLQFPEVPWIMLLDDDLIFSSNCFNCIDFCQLDKASLWFALPNESIGSPTHKAFESVPRKICKALGLYPRPGKIASSGFHAPISGIDENTGIEWAPTALMIFYVGAGSIFPDKLLSEEFQGYGYLEDLEMSIRIREQGVTLRLLEIEIQHPVTVRDSFAFGKTEVINRAKVLKKLNGGSVVSFSIMISFRILKSFWESIIGRGGFGRFLGSLHGIILLIVGPAGTWSIQEDKK